MTDKKAPEKPKMPSPLKFLLPRISWSVVLIPIAIVALLLLGSAVTGIMRTILMIVGSIGGGLMIAGFITVVIVDKESWRVMAGGASILVPALAVFTILFGLGWLTVFGIYTGVLTAILLLLETRRRLNGRL
jgi:hypothetical protein